MSFPLELVHIPKTGGTALTYTFEECEWGISANRDKVIMKIPNYSLENFGPPCSFWHNHELIDTLYQGSKTFCVIRDPWSRILSEYRYLHLPDDVSTLNSILSKWKVEVEEDPFCYDNHLAPQHLFADKCDHVLLFDNLEENVNRLVEQYGIAPRPLVEGNVSSRYHQVTSKEIISLENKTWIQSYYAKDFEWYQRLLEKKFFVS